MQEGICDSPSSASEAVVLASMLEQLSSSELTSDRITAEPSTVSAIADIIEEASHVTKLFSTATFDVLRVIHPRLKTMIIVNSVGADSVIIQSAPLH